LFRARGISELVPELFRLVDESDALSVEWTTPDRFSAARKFMLKHLDQKFSFTDCVSFVLMKELGLKDALATDNHFRVAGFHPLLAR
jgi:predicted nucleic acid-binding protein